MFAFINRTSENSTDTPYLGGLNHLYPSQSIQSMPRGTNLPYLCTLRTSTLHLCSTDTPYHTLKPRRVSLRQLKKKGNGSTEALKACPMLPGRAYVHIQPTLLHPECMTTIYISISETLLSLGKKQWPLAIRVSEPGLSPAPLADAVLYLDCQRWAQELRIVKIS